MNVGETTGQRLTRRTALRLVGGVAAGAAAAAGRVGRPAAGQGAPVAIEIGLTQNLTAPDHPALRLIEAFNAQTLGYRATGTNYGADYEEVMQKAQANIAARIPPALVVTGWKYALFADAALGIVDLREVGGDRLDPVLGRYRPWVVDIVRVGDKIAGLPFALSTPILYYNKDLFGRAGLDPEQPPRTWEEAAAFAGRLRERAGVEAPLVGGIDEWEAQSFIQNAGGFVLDGGGKAVFDSPEAIAGMGVWANLRAEGLYVPLDNAQVTPTFLAGSAAMLFTSVAALGNINRNAAFPVGTAEWPAIGERPKLMPSGGNFLGVYSRDPEQQAGAWAFLDFASSPEGVAIWNETGYLVATTDPLPPLPGQEPGYRQMEAGLTNETIWPGPRGLEALSVFNDWMARVVRGEVAVEEGMREGTAAVAALLP